MSYTTADKKHTKCTTVTENLATMTGRQGSTARTEANAISWRSDMHNNQSRIDTTSNRFGKIGNAHAGDGPWRHVHTERGHVYI